MDFSLNDEQRLMRESASRFVRDRYTLEARRALIASDVGFDENNWRHMAEMGWLALSIPESAGGLGGSTSDLAILMLELGRGCYLEPLVPTAVLGAGLLEESPLSAELLPQIVEGTLRLAFAHSEAGADFDLERTPQTRAVADDGNFRIVGKKYVVCGAPSAQAILVTAATPDGATALYVVDRNAPGLTIDSYPLIDGTRAADVVLDNTPAREALPSAVARKAIAQAVDKARIAMFAEAVGSMEVSLDVCSDYIKERQQFGQPIGKFQALQHMMAEMFVEAQAARSALYQAIAAFDTQPSNRTCAIASAAIVVGDAARTVTRHGLQLHGGYGITEEFWISHHYRRQMVLERSLGDMDFHLRTLVETR
jgi:alkylation response protein AidB-like acyl-CoA dehydrogenase